MSTFESSVDNLISNNKKYAEKYTSPHKVEQFLSGEQTFPSVILISCCDPRIIPEEFGLFSREEYVVVRNAGGRAEPAVRDISVLCAFAKITDLVVIHHTDCGLTHLTNDAVRNSLKSANLGDDRLDTMEFGEIKKGVAQAILRKQRGRLTFNSNSLEQSVIDDVEFLKNSPYISKEINIHGYVFDMLESGALILV